MKLASKTVILLLALGALSGARGQYLEATIPVGDTPKWPMWSPLGNKVYVANTQDGTVSVLDGATNSVIATIPVEDYPDVFALNTVDGKVYCPSGSEDRLNVICAYGDTLIRKVRLSGYPSFPAYNERRNKLYVSAQDNDCVYVLDGQTDEVIEVLDIRHPMWLSLQPETDRLLVPSDLDSDTVVVVDCYADTVSARQPLPNDVRSASRIGLAGKVYVPCRFVVEVFSADCEEHLASITTSVYAPWSAAYCPAAAKLYIGDFNRGQIAVINCRTDSVVGEIGAGEMAYSMVCDTTRGRLYSLSDQKLLVFDTRNDSLAATVSYPRYSGTGLAWNPVSRKLYAASPGGNVVYVVRDTTTAVSEEPAAAVARRAGSRIVRGVLDLPTSGVGHQASSVLLDAAGRRVADLRPGLNDLRRLSPGVYFIKESSDVRSRRVVLVR